MSALTYIVGAPVSVAVVLLVLRFAPTAVLTVLAGATAIIARDKRAARALVVLQMLRPNSRTTPAEPAARQQDSATPSPTA
ncbi:hypothetical protein SAMN05421805_107133 [Saccharopolyspora antimicrobica]|uniref:Uncharacterized protein n=1 Tax=Saccharopolyspora antimicrobica TaxID=455193 RepID=A0A1I5CCD8_9PSEU|nr:hypothetical protein [Saccharopolyspora antimicrobica]RKT88904.1 hypothetical protein ATL45_7347 [Saccharopolyspora antimicrobica]SFN84566.1 hypothetical protein SAMN05421805_107133 [Saccharopolyspora antimicrobica]